MIPELRRILVAAKSLSCALALCALLAAADFVVTHVQASGYVVAQEAGRLLPAQNREIAVEDSDVIPSSENRTTEEDDLPVSDPPGTDDPHNSTGDDVVVRIPR